MNNLPQTSCLHSAFCWTSESCIDWDSVSETLDCEVTCAELYKVKITAKDFKRGYNI